MSASIKVLAGQGDGEETAVNNPLRIMLISLAEDLSTRRSPICTQDIDRVITNNYSAIWQEFRKGAAARIAGEFSLALMAAQAERLTELAQSGNTPERQAELLAWLSGSGSSQLRETKLYHEADQHGQAVMSAPRRD